MLDSGRGRTKTIMNTSDERHPVLYGAVGLDRHGIVSGGMGFLGTGRGARAVLLSESLSFDGPEGATVTVTSRRPGDDDQFERARTWAPTGPYLALPAAERRPLGTVPGQPLARSRSTGCRRRLWSTAKLRRSR